MDEAIDTGSKINVTTGLDAHAEEPSPHDEQVVVAMQKRELLFFLSKDHPQGVKELDELVVVMKPDQGGDREPVDVALDRSAPHTLKPRIRVHLIHHTGDSNNI